MSNLDIAKQKLTEVGAALTKAYKSGECAQLQVMPLLKTLKTVNTSLVKIINGEDPDEFSFDTIEESVPAVKTSAKRMSESQQQDFGVDLGGFNDLLTPENNPDAFDWKQTFQEANKTKVGGVNVSLDDIDMSNFDPGTLGRMIDNT